MTRAHRPLSTILLVLAAMMAVTSQAGASTPGQAAIGLYSGPADTAEQDSLSAWLGNEATYALDFVDSSQSWTTIASGSDWLLDPWSSWVRAQAGRRLVISVPMLNQASSGRLADGAAGAFDSYFRTLAQEIADTGLGGGVGVGDNPYFVDRMADWFAANAATLRFQSYFHHLSDWTGDHRLSTFVNARARYRSASRAITIRN